MGRRRKSGLDKAVELTALIPWKVSLALAPVAWAGLHWLASAKVVTPTNTAQLGNTLVVQVLITFATIGQYLLPVVLLFGALGNYCVSRRQARHDELVSALGTQQSLLDMSWQEFERLVAEYFQRRGYAVTLRGGSDSGGGPDGGVDIELRQGSELALVQCKQWRATRVGVEVVRQLYGVMAARGASNGYVVTSADFTPDALNFVTGRNIHLVNGEQLVRHMRKAAPAAEEFEPKRTVMDMPRCPKCQATMIKRVSQQGSITGQSFWGCQRFPACRGTRPV